MLLIFVPISGIEPLNKTVWEVGVSAYHFGFFANLCVKLAALNITEYLGLSAVIFPLLTAHSVKINLLSLLRMIDIRSNYIL